MLILCHLSGPVGAPGDQKALRMKGRQILIFPRRRSESFPSQVCVFEPNCNGNRGLRAYSVAGQFFFEATEKPLGIPSKTTEIIANHLWIIWWFAINFVSLYCWYI